MKAFLLDSWSPGTGFFPTNALNLDHFMRVKNKLVLNFKVYKF